MTGPRRKPPSSAGLAESVRTGRRSAATREQEAGVALRSLQFAITCATCLRRTVLNCVLALIACSATLGPLREAKAATSQFNNYVIMSRECPSHGRPQRSEDGRLGGAGRAQAIGRARNRVGSTCTCILGSTRACGACTNGKTGEYGACTGAVLTPTTWYRDADGDGYGSAVTTTVCTTTQPVGYTDRTGDCCDDGGNLTLAAKIHPGQMDWFETAANLCGITWDYDCSTKHELRTKQVAMGCVSGATPPNCTSVYWDLTDSSCGTTVSHSICYELPTPPSGSKCATTGNGGPQGCH